MRTVSVDQFEFDNPSTEESLEITTARRGATPQEQTQISCSRNQMLTHSGECDRELFARPSVAPPFNSASNFRSSNQ